MNPVCINLPLLKSTFSKDGSLSPGHPTNAISPLTTLLSPEIASFLSVWTIPPSDFSLKFVPKAPSPLSASLSPKVPSVFPGIHGKGSIFSLLSAK